MSTNDRRAGYWSGIETHKIAFLGFNMLGISQNFQLSDMCRIIAVVTGFTTTENLVLYKSYLNQNATFCKFHLSQDVVGEAFRLKNIYGIISYGNPLGDCTLMVVVC